MADENVKEVPIQVVGGSTFGRYPKISLEKTVNMYISDEWLVNFPGYQKRYDFNINGAGRGIFHSIRGNFALVVIAQNVYKVTPGLFSQFKGALNTSSGEVSMAENLNDQIAIADGSELWIFNSTTNSFSLQPLEVTPLVGSKYNVVPRYVQYHNTSFLIGSAKNSDTSYQWYAATPDGTANIKINADDVFPLQTKSDFALAVVPLPGRGNNVMVFGSSVSEIWTQVGGVENYRRLTSENIDYGVASVDTIAKSDSFIIWLAQNENNAVFIMISTGSESKRISTDGIDYLLQTVRFPEKSTGLMFRQDGHLFYILTFYDDDDNFSILYDLNTQKFFHLCDENQDYFIAREVIYIDGVTYFVSLRDSGLYEMSTNFLSYNENINEDLDGFIIPRFRICNTVRMPDGAIFRSRRFTFGLEQGVNQFPTIFVDGNVCFGVLVTEDSQDIIGSETGVLMLAWDGSCSTDAGRPVVDMAISINGNQSFSPWVRRKLNPDGQYRNQISWDRIGRSNEITLQLRFYGNQRYVATNGILEIFR